jgi:hypothetical protein
MKFEDCIGIENNAISAQECLEIINFFESNKKYHSLGNISSNTPKNIESIDFSVKRSIDFCRKFDMYDIPEKIIIKCFKYNMPNYEKKFNSLEKLEKWQLCNNYNIRKYEPNMDFYKEHCEVHGITGHAAKRMLTWMIYLNDVTEGGETYFRYQNLKISSEVGKLLIWPPFWTHPHFGIPSMNQIKYIVTGWFEFV